MTDKLETKTYATAQFWVEGGMYSINGLKELIKHFEKISEQHSLHLSKSLQPTEKKNKKGQE